MIYNTKLTQYMLGPPYGKCKYPTQNDSVTDLGVIVDADSRFKQHLNNIVLKANQRSALSKRSFISKNTSNIHRAFRIYVRPILEYASTT